MNSSTEPTRAPVKALGGTRKKSSPRRQKPTKSPAPKRSPKPKPEPEYNSPAYKKLVHRLHGEQIARFQRYSRGPFLYLITEECYELEREYRVNECLEEMIRQHILDGPGSAGEDHAVWRNGRLVAMIRWRDHDTPCVVMLDDPRPTDERFQTLWKHIARYDREAALYATQMSHVETVLRHAEDAAAMYEEANLIKQPMADKRREFRERLERATFPLVRAIVRLSGQKVNWFNDASAENVRPCSVRVGGRLFSVVPRPDTCSGELDLVVTQATEFIDFDARGKEADK